MIKYYLDNWYKLRVLKLTAQETDKNFVPTLIFVSLILPLQSAKATVTCNNTYIPTYLKCNNLLENGFLDWAPEGVRNPLLHGQPVRHNVWESGWLAPSKLYSKSCQVLLGLGLSWTSRPLPWRQAWNSHQRWNQFNVKWTVHVHQRLNWAYWWW